MASQPLSSDNFYHHCPSLFTWKGESRNKKLVLVSFFGQIANFYRVSWLSNNRMIDYKKNKKGCYSIPIQVRFLSRSESNQLGDVFIPLPVEWFRVFLPFNPVLLCPCLATMTKLSDEIAILLGLNTSSATHCCNFLLLLLQNCGSLEEVKCD